jgi:cytochrome P450
MALYPEVQRAAHAEIDAVLGDSRLPDFSDEDKLPYVGAVLKEVFRWHPVAPLGGLNVVALISYGAYTGMRIRHPTPCHER